MKKVYLKIIFFLFLGVFFITYFPQVMLDHHRAYAQSSNEYSSAYFLPIKDTRIQAGDIISFSPHGYIKTTTAYDQYIVGIVTQNPAIVENFQGSIPTYPITSTGDTEVLVSTTNGAIKQGDFITSSTIPGVGMKATKSGYSIGVALQSLSTTNAKEIGKIPVSLNPHYTTFINNSIATSLLDIANLSAIATYESPSVVFKYVVVAVIVLVTISFCFILISRTANKGIDALGRNPLSSRDIHIAVVINVLISVIILFFGFLMAFLVLRL